MNLLCDNASRMKKYHSYSSIRVFIWNFFQLRRRVNPNTSQPLIANKHITHNKLGLRLQTIDEHDDFQQYISVRPTFTLFVYHSANVVISPMKREQRI
jgi:hypothetical protein